ncbi:response regulator transcription factor [Carboxydochorda subterranea]|uniref:Response regulator transcription factor n=1 Tax=Carboxydichorda subterranea TaxID=3109565 RepID=A0ABZ1BY17_9FIRM|nr:response regulator transcription factor [Limnochorda sp. L945t]WRP17405.1 response regulator transcription factor [Limnochorda sp. L945t]
MSARDEETRQFEELWPFHVLRWGLVTAGIMAWLWAGSEGLARWALLVAALVALDLALYGPGQGRARPLWGSLQIALGIAVFLVAPGRDFQVTAVTNGREAVEVARQDPPSLAVIDVRMPVMGGVECTRVLKAEHPGMPVLVLTTFDDYRLVEACLEAEANAYLLKDIHPDDLANAIRLLHAGERLIPGDLAERGELWPELARSSQGRLTRYDGAALPRRRGPRAPALPATG